MTKKDYELIANCLNYAINGNTVEVGGDVWAIVHSLTKVFEVDNPKFNRTKFLMACGIETVNCNMCDEGVTEYPVKDGICTWCERPVKD